MCVCVCVNVCTPTFVYSHRSRWEREKKLKTCFKGNCWDNKKRWPFYIFLSLLKRSAIKLPFSPTAPVRSVYCLLSSQCDTHDSLPIITNSTRRVNKRDKRPLEQPMRGWLSGMPWQRITLRCVMCQGGVGVSRERNKERKWLSEEKIQPFLCPAQQSVEVKHEGFCSHLLLTVLSWFKPYLTPRVLWSMAHPLPQADRPSNGLSGMARLERKLGQEGWRRWCLIADSFSTFWLKIHKACWSHCLWRKKWTGR